MKRGIISLAGPSPKIRISKTGKSADSSDPNDFLFHEGYIFSSLVGIGTINRPASSPYTVSIVFPFRVDLGDVHIDIIQQVSPVLHIFPSQRQSWNYIPSTVGVITWQVLNEQLTIDMTYSPVSAVSYVLYKE